MIKILILLLIQFILIIIETYLLVIKLNFDAILFSFKFTTYRILSNKIIKLTYLNSFK